MSGYDNIFLRPESLIRDDDYTQVLDIDGDLDFPLAESTSFRSVNGSSACPQIQGISQYRPDPSGSTASSSLGSGTAGVVSSSGSLPIPSTSCSHRPAGLPAGEHPQALAGRSRSNAITSPSSTRSLLLLEGGRGHELQRGDSQTSCTDDTFSSYCMDLDDTPQSSFDSVDTFSPKTSPRGGPTGSPSAVAPIGGSWADLASLDAVATSHGASQAMAASASSGGAGAAPRMIRSQGPLRPDLSPFPSFTSGSLAGDSWANQYANFEEEALPVFNSFPPEGFIGNPAGQYNNTGLLLCHMAMGFASAQGDPAFGEASSLRSGRLGPPTESAFLSDLSLLRSPSAASSGQPRSLISDGMTARRSDCPQTSPSGSLPRGRPGPAAPPSSTSLLALQIRSERSGSPTVSPVEDTAMFDFADTEMTDVLDDVPDVSALAVPAGRSRAVSSASATGRPRGDSSASGSPDKRNPRGKRVGALDPATRVNAKDRRNKRTVCRRCKSRKTACAPNENPDLPCQQCVVASSLDRPVVCSRAWFSYITESGTMNYISQVAANHQNLTSTRRVRLDLPDRVCPADLLQQIDAVRANYDFQVKQGDLALYTLDLDGCYEFVKSMCGSMGDAADVYHDSRDFIDRVLPQKGDWSVCVKGFDPRGREVALMSTWNNMPSRATYVYVAKDGSDTRVQMNPESPSSARHILLAHRLASMVLRRLELDGYLALEKRIQGPKMHTELLVAFLRELGKNIVTLRWRYWWWKTLGGGGSQQQDSELGRERFEERVTRMCSSLYFHYCHFRSTIHSWAFLDGVGDQLRGINSHYADTANGIFDNFPGDDTLDGFNTWMQHGRELIREAGVERRLKVIGLALK